MSYTRGERWVLAVGRRSKGKYWPGIVFLLLCVAMLAVGVARDSALPVALGALFLSLGGNHIERVLFYRIIERQAAEIAALRAGTPVPPQPL